MNYTLKIERDTDAQNPREEHDGFLGTMVCFHNKYDLGDKGHGYSVFGDASGWDGLRDLIQKDHAKGVVILPIYMYDHSGITINTSPFSCPWDSGQIGYIFTPIEKVIEAFGNDEVQSLVRAMAWLESEVREYDQYLQGDVWGYTVEDGDGEHVDSCWGFYGEEVCRQEGKDVLTSLIAQDVEAARALDHQREGFPNWLVV